MAASSLSLSSPLLLLLHFCTLTQQTGTPHHSLSLTTSKLNLEEGYTVSTVLDGDKLPDPINPSYFLPRLRGTHDLVVLDSPKSLFYTVSLPISQDSVINRFSGNGTGFADGELGSAMFNRPQSFAVDGKGNVYVADKNNHAIRKISPSGVTTVAGGHSSGKPGNVDGPAQDASFSNNFELTFVPDICALLISDRGNRLIRQMNLKSADCGGGSSSRFQMGLALSALLGVSCLLLGLVTGGVISYRFLNSRTSTSRPRLRETWKLSQIHLERRVLIVYSDIKSAVANSRVYSLMGRLAKMSLSHLHLILNLSRLERVLHREPVTSFDSDCGSNHETTKSQIFADQLKDLISFDEDFSAPEDVKVNCKQGDDEDEISDVLTVSHRSIDGLIHANISDFTRHVRQQCPSDVSSSVLVKRR